MCEFGILVTCCYLSGLHRSMCVIHLLFVRFSSVTWRLRFATIWLHFVQFDLRTLTDRLGRFPLSIPVRCDTIAFKYAVNRLQVLIFYFSNVEIYLILYFIWTPTGLHQLEYPEFRWLNVVIEIRRRNKIDSSVAECGILPESANDDVIRQQRNLGNVVIISLRCQILLMTWQVL